MLLVTALAGGILCDRWYPFVSAVWWSISAFGLSGWLVACLWRREALASSLVFLGALGIGGALHHAHWRLYAADEISRMVAESPRPACVEAIAITSPRWVPAPPPTPLRTIPQGERSELLVWLTAVRDGTDFRPASGWAALDVGGKLDDIRAGDALRIMSLASRPASPLNPGEFDFADYARTQRIGCRLFAEFPASVERLSRGSAWSLRRWLADLRAGGSAVLRRHISAERATLASAVLLGTREQLDTERNENYLVTGTIHVLSISGLHVGILAAAFFVLLRIGLLPRRLTLLATMALTIGYALLTDAEPPVVRATVLVVATCVAVWSGRSAFGFSGLAAAAIVVLAMNPSSLFLTGPQLSFLAVATMIAFHQILIPQPIVDPLDRLIASTRPRLVRLGRQVGGLVWRVWLTGALIWLVSTPLVWKQYHLFSPSALVLNFAMWAPITVAMYSGLGTLVFGGLLPVAGRMLGLVCDHSLHALEKTIVMGRGWPGSYVWLAAPPGWWIGLFYVGLAAWAVFPPLRPPRRWILASGAAWMAGALALSGPISSGPISSAMWTNQKPLTCHFVAVGHGVCVLVELPDGKTLLYDAGRLGSPHTGVRAISSVLWSRGITHLDAVVVSHADADHFNALPGLLDRFSIGAVYVSPVMFERLPPAVQELRDSLERSHVSVREIWGGQRLAISQGTTVEVLHPPRKGVSGSDNANSIVLLIEHAGRRVLLTGDLESPGLDDVLAERPLDCDVVLAPHHGSPRSNPGRFAEWSTPEFVVISGSNAPGGMPANANVKHSFRLRGAEVFHTAEDGCVCATIDAGALTVRSFRPHVRTTPIELASTSLLQAE